MAGFAAGRPNMGRRRFLASTAFTIAHLDEWGPTDEQMAARPELAEERERPMMLLVSARR
jgi:hypothetical protein